MKAPEVGGLAVTSGPQAFLSYTRIDDEFFGGAITSLRRLLELGVQVVTGDQSFQIFQDIEGIELGQQWQRRLDQAISEAKFLIPVLTPSFFRSDACRDELHKFMKHEKAIGRDDLILPIYLVTTPSIEKEELLRKDHLAAEVSKRQRFDWRSQADLPIDDLRVRRAVRELAEKIAAAIARTCAIARYNPDLDQQRDAQFKAASELVASEVGAARDTVDEKLILWVDDKPSNNVFERQILEAYNIKFVLAKSTEEALKINSKFRFDVIISDMGRPPDPRAGYTLLDALRTEGDRTPYLIYAGYKSPEHVAEARLRGAQGTTNIAAELIEMVLALIRGQSNRES